MPEIFLPRIASHTIRGFFMPEKGGGWRMAMVDSTPVGQERRPLSHRRKRTITDSNGQKRTSPFGVARDGVWCGWATCTAALGEWTIICDRITVLDLTKTFLEIL